MEPLIHRRKFIQNAGALALLPTLGFTAQERKTTLPSKTANIKLSCNLYSFNEPLTLGTMNLEGVIDFCADLGFDAIDPTGYYFPAYPEVPEDEYIYHIKQKAFLQGLAISGTGIRNDFTLPDKSKREADIDLIRNWVEVAAKLGAPLLRIFAGHEVPAGHTEEEVFEWVIEDIKTCVAYGKQYGVIIALQNHNDLLKTADQVLHVIEQVDSDWLGLNLDIGSLRTTDDPYEEIAKLAPYACTWQIKENVYRNQQEEKTDMNQMVKILKESGYRGYIPLETLGPGDPKEKLPPFLEEVREALGRSI
jgi:sugar phosphate isomerase/epimerase